jgi:hypothetical protein
MGFFWWPTATQICLLPGMGCLSEIMQITMHCELRSIIPFPTERFRAPSDSQSTLVLGVVSAWCTLVGIAKDANEGIFW